MSLRSCARRAAYRLAPVWARSFDEYRGLCDKARELRRQCPPGAPLEQCLDLVLGQKAFRAEQKRSEILPLLTRLRDLRPRHLCEIGAAGGGTLFLLCQVAAPDARICSIDIAFPRARRRLYPRLVQPGQRLTCLAADSHQQTTLQRVTRWLQGQRLDFLFIDGDHSLRGVTQDYEMYGPLVRPGGLIGFHDINPDFQTRFGVQTPSDVGEVPAFWATLKRSGAKVEEFIQDPEQDGYGIGLISVAAKSC